MTKEKSKLIEEKKIEEMEKVPVATFDYSSVVGKIGLPVVKANASGKDLIFLIDSGSTHCILSKPVCDELKEHIKDLNAEFSLYGLEANQQMVQRAQTKLNVCNVEFDMEFNVVDMSAPFGQMLADTGIQLHGIIGMDFLIENRWAVDFGSSVVVIPMTKE